MKKYILPLLFLPFLTTLITACDNGPFSEVVNEENINLEDAPVVLVEEFTGQKCSNCPTAAKALHKIAKDYYPNVLVVAMHVKGSSFTKAPLATDDAANVSTHFALPSTLPFSMINRKKVDSKRDLGSISQWEGIIRSLLNEKKKASVSIEKINLEEDKLSLSISTQQATNLKLHLWIVENLIADQTNAEDGYLHMNVLRKSLTDITGISTQESMTQTYNIQKRENDSSSTQLLEGEQELVQDLDYAQVIAFLTNEKDEVVNAVAKPFTEKFDNPLGKEKGKEKGHEAKKPVAPSPFQIQDAMSFGIVEKSESGESKILQIKADETYECHHTESSYGGNTAEQTSFATPNIYIIPAKGTALPAQYTLTVSKEDAKEEKGVGVSQLCFGGSCKQLIKMDFSNPGSATQGPEYTDPYTDDWNLTLPLPNPNDTQLDSAYTNQNSNQSLSVHFDAKTTENVKKGLKIKVSLTPKTGTNKQAISFYILFKKDQ